MRIRVDDEAPADPSQVLKTYQKTIRRGRNLAEIRLPTLQYKQAVGKEDSHRYTYTHIKLHN